MNLADMMQSNKIELQHRELKPSSMLGSEDSVQRALKAIEEFTNQCAVDPTRLVRMTSGGSVLQEIQNNGLRAENISKEGKEAFIKEMLKGFLDQ